tara:strand:+ start:270 stop:620 length:351 start_codon:yes stop_codon:yes gene_type:complete
MISFKRDDNRDLFLNSRNDISMNSDLDACLQTCESVAMLLRGEDIYNISEGLPNFELVWDGVPNIPQYRAALISAIEKVNDVIKVSNYDFIVNNNELIYNIEIETNFGNGVISNEL